MKKLSFILVFVMIISIFSVTTMNVNAATATEGDLTFTYYTSTKTATLTKCETSASGNIEIPEYIGLCKVTEIANNAFKNCKLIESVTMPDTIKKIGGYVFYYCSSLKTVKLSSNATSIGAYTFNGCIELIEITLPNKLQTIGNYVFQGCSALKNIVIPSSVTSIGTAAFNGCTSIESITLPFIGSSKTANKTYDAVFGYIFGNTTINNSSTTTQQYYADGSSQYYYIPSSIKSVTVTNTEQIPYGAFYNCSNIESIIIPETVTSIGTAAFDNTGISTISIPASIKTIPTRAFLGCDNLKTVNIADGVETISGQAFQGCTVLESIDIPKSITSITNGCFFGCDNLKSINVDEENTAYLSVDGVLFDKEKTTLIAYPIGKDGAYTVPDGVTQISYSAFSNCDGLTEINFPQSLTAIGSSAFSNCTSLKSVTIPKNVTLVGNSAFRYDTAIEKIVFENSPVVVEDYAFAVCDSISELDLGNAIKTIGVGSFSTNARTIAQVVLPDTLESIGEQGLTVASNIEKLYIGTGLKSLGKYAFGGVLSMGVKYVDIKDMAQWCNMEFPSVYYNTNPLIGAKKIHLNGELVTDLKIPDSVEIIKYSVFNGIEELDNIYIPKSVTSIEAMNFYTTTVNENVYYEGSKSDWANVEVITYNDGLTNANIIFEVCDCGGEYGEWETEIAPTYIKSGNNLRCCTLCGDEQKQIVKGTGIVKVGDIDGDLLINSVDLSEIRILLINGTDNELITDAADTNGNGEIDIKDLVRLKKYDAGYNVKLGE